MCGRYYVDETILKEIKQIVREPDRSLFPKKPRDIYPTQSAPVLAGQEEEVFLEQIRWGFPGFEKAKVIINARAETAWEKPMFREGLSHSRCVVPAGGFYEWNQEKEKYTCLRKDGKPLFLAGCLQMTGEGSQFVILTTASNDSMVRIHQRMPLILEDIQVKDWILSKEAAERMTRQIPAPIRASAEYEQQTLRFE